MYMDETRSQWDLDEARWQALSTVMRSGVLQYCCMKALTCKVSKAWGAPSMASVVAPMIWISGDGFYCCCMLTIICVCFLFKVASMISSEDEFQSSLWCSVLLKRTCVFGCSVHVLIVQNCWLCSSIDVVSIHNHSVESYCLHPQLGGKLYTTMYINFILKCFNFNMVTTMQSRKKILNLSNNAAIYPCFCLFNCLSFSSSWISFYYHF